MTDQIPYRRISVTIEGEGTYEFFRTAGFEGILTDDGVAVDVSLDFTSLFDTDEGANYRFTEETP
jgi:hypothetical protein